MKSKASIALLCSLLFYSCYKSENNISIQGYAPIYVASSSIKSIYASNTPSSITTGGKILTQGYRIYVVESGSGVHILNYNGLNAPEHLSFIHIKGCQDIALKDNYLYANNLDDLVTLDIANIYNPKVLSRNEGVFADDLSLEHPPLTGFYYECPRDNDSIIVGWELTILKNPKCYYE